jgi:hypothetical protein
VSVVPPPGRSVGRLAASCLVLEAFLVFFATLVALRLSDLPDGTVWLAGAGLSLICLVVAGLVRRRIGLVLGIAVQVLLLVSALWVPAMLFLGVVFLALWFWMINLGARVDRTQRDHETRVRR